MVGERGNEDANTLAMNDLVQQAWKAFCLQPSEDTFAAFHQGTSGFIFTMCLRVLGDDEEARDVLQTVYSELLMLAHAGNDGLEIANIDNEVRNLTLRFAETRKKSISRGKSRFRDDDVLEQMADESPSTRTALGDQQIHGVVREAIASLEPTLRQALLMQYEEGLTHQQIANALGISRPHTTRLLQKATEGVQTYLHSVGITQSVLVLLTLVLGKKLLSGGAAMWAGQVYARAMAMKSTAVPTVAPVSQYLKAAVVLKSKAAMLSAGAAIVALFIFSIHTLHKDHTPATASISGKERIASSNLIPTERKAILGPSKRSVNPEPSPSNTPAGPLLVAASPGQPQGTIYGQVLARFTGEPMPNIKVQVSEPGSTSVDPRLAVVSDPNGKFQLPHVPPGRHLLKVLPDEPWVAEVTTTTVIANEPTDVGPIQINRLGAIYGTIINDANGEPARDLTVQIQKAGFQKVAETKTDALGQFVFKRLELPEYAVHLPAQLITRSLTMPGGQDAKLTLHIGQSNLSGLVTHAGQPIKQASIQAHKNENSGYLSQQTWADSEGRYKLAGLPAGQWIVEASFADKTPTIKAISNIDLETTESAVWDAVVPSAKVTGFTLSDQGTVLPNLSVRAQSVYPDTAALPETIPSDIVCTSSATGYFEFASLPPGRYLMSAIASDGRIGKSSTINVTDRGESRSNVIFRTQHTGRLVSTVLSYSDEQPLAQAWCTILGPNGPISITQNRKPDGRLVVDGLEAGTYVVSVSAFGYTATSRTVEIREGETSVLDDVLDDGGNFRWILFDQNGMGRAGVQCRLNALDPNSIERARAGMTDGNGEWSLRGLRAGRYAAVASIEGKSVSLTIVINPRSLTQNRTQLPTIEASREPKSTNIGG